MPVPSAAQNTPRLAEAMSRSNWRNAAKPDSRMGKNLGMVRRRRSRVSSGSSNSACDFDVEDSTTLHRRSSSGSSPARSASSIGFTHDTFFDSTQHVKVNEDIALRSSVGIISAVAINAACDSAASTKRSASAIDILARPQGEQRNGFDSASFAIDIVLLDPKCRHKRQCLAHRGHYPTGEIESVRKSKPFKPCNQAEKMYERESNESSQYSDHIEDTKITKHEESDFDQRTNRHNALERDNQPLCRPSQGQIMADPTTQAIMAEEAVLDMSGLNGNNHSDSLSDNTKRSGFDNIISKLKVAEEEYRIRTVAGMRTLTDEPPLAVRKITPSPRQQRSDSSNDSGVVIKKEDKEEGGGKSITLLNPAAKEFVARANLHGQEHPFMIEHAGREKSEHDSRIVAAEEEAVRKQRALAAALDHVADYSKDSFENLQEVVQKTVQQFGIPSGGPFPTTMGPAGYPPGMLPPLDCGFFQPTPPFSSVFGPFPPVMNAEVNGSIPFNMGFHRHMPILPPDFAPPAPGPNEVGFSMGPFGTGICHLVPPLSDGPFGPLPMPPPGYGSGVGFGPGPFGPRLDWSTLLPHGHMQTPPWAPGPPNQVGFPPRGPVNQQRGLSVSFQKPVAVRRPRAPDATAQQVYEAHIEWRKANEPGYALKCKQRQSRRAIRSFNSASVSQASSTAENK